MSPKKRNNNKVLRKYQVARLCHLEGDKELLREYLSTNLEDLKNKNMKNKIDKKIKTQAEQFVKEICIDLWGMSSKEVKNYCIMIIKQNMMMAKFNKDYLETTKAYAKITGLSKKDLISIFAHACRH